MNLTYAQNNEDAMLKRALMNINNGFYIDIGANDPDVDSVSKAFYLDGWCGINVEPLSSAKKKFDFARPRDINLTVAISDFRGTADLLINGGLSTMEYDEVSRNKTISGFEKVTVMTLQDLLERYVPLEQDVHFLKIDAEGSEAKIINAYDWKKWRPWIVVAEAMLPNTQEPTHLLWEKSLERNGYKFVWFDGLNRFYIRNESLDFLEKSFQAPINIFDNYIRHDHAAAINYASIMQATLNSNQVKINELKTQNINLEKQNRQFVEEKESVNRYVSDAAPGICVVSCFKANNGVGQAARIITSGLISAGLPYSNTIVHLEQYQDTEEWSVPNPNLFRRANLAIWDILSAWQIGQILNRTQFNILYPFWELEKLPIDAKHSLTLFDELWAPSQFIYDGVRDQFKHKTLFVRQPVLIPDKPYAPSYHEFTVFMFFDTDSWQSRKNPFAAVDAFRAAFSGRDDNVRLIVKLKGKADHGARAWLSEITSKDSRISVIDKALTRPEIDCLVRNSHVYISLHRSEGFGFGPAEAMAAGKPVIATDYGGTTDFVSRRTGYPIEYNLVKTNVYDYPGGDILGQVWADPKIEHAAECLQAVYNDYEEALSRGLEGRKFLITHHSQQAFSARVAEILTERGLL